MVSTNTLDHHLCSVFVKTPRWLSPAGCRVKDSIVPGQARQKNRPCLLLLNNMFWLTAPEKRANPYVICQFSFEIVWNHSRFISLKQAFLMQGNC